MLTEVKQKNIYLRHGFVNYRTDLLNYALIKTNNESLAEDLVQNTYLKTWVYMVKGGRVNVMKVFLFRVLRSLIDEDQYNNQPSSLEVLVDHGMRIYSDDVSTNNTSYDKEKALELIDELPRLYQKILRLRYLQNLTIDEISKVTGRSRNTVTVQSHRGLKKLKQLYFERINS